MVIIGHTRFSLFDPHSAAWVASNGSRLSSAAEYQDYLYSPERLELRCKIFLEYSLPQLERAARGHDYYHVVSYSDSLPPAYRNRLNEAAIRFPFLVLDCHIDGKGRINLDNLAAEKLGRSGSNVGSYATFRLDDDDILAANFFDQVLSFVDESNAGMVVSLARGITAIYNDGEFFFAREAYSPMNSMGLLNICHVDAAGNITKPVASSHNRADRHNAVILDAREISFLWVRHEGQDTALSAATHDRANQQASVVADLRRSPALSEEVSVNELFPGLSMKLHRSLPGSVSYTDAPVPLTPESITVEFISVLSGSFHIEGELLHGLGSTVRSALLVFEFSNAAGEVISDHADLERLLKAQGVALSPSPVVGYFRYIGNVPGTHVFEISLSLPDGIYCRAVRIQPWGAPVFGTLLNRLQVAQI